MKITVLGSGSEATLKPDYEGIRRMSPAVLMSEAGCTILFDAGPNIQEQLGSLVPDHVFISHLHHDHYAGVGCFPEEKVTLRHGGNVGSFNVMPFAVKHSKVAPAVGYEVICSEVKVLYIPDYLGIYNMEHVKETTIALLDGTSLIRDVIRDSTKTIGHRSIMNSLKMARDYTIPNVVFLHMGRIGAVEDIEYRVESIAQEIGYQGSIFVSKDGESYVISNKEALREIKNTQNYNPTRLTTTELLADYKVVIAWYINMAKNKDLTISIGDIETLYQQIVSELLRRGVDLHPDTMKPEAKELYDRYKDNALATTIGTTEPTVKSTEEKKQQKELLARHEEIHHTRPITKELINDEIKVHNEALSIGLLLPIYADELEMAVLDDLPNHDTTNVSEQVVPPNGVREVIKHDGNKWVLYSHDGTKKLGEFDTEEAAKKRERQINYFKYINKEVIEVGNEYLFN